MANLGPIKRQFGIAPDLEGCHTAVVDGRYVIEGHVPADVIARMVSEGLEAQGLSVPGMPVGSPGMEIPGRQPEPYDVIAFDKQGKRWVYESR